MVREREKNPAIRIGRGTRRAGMGGRKVKKMRQVRQGKGAILQHPRRRILVIPVISPPP
tara:strand:+ start:704 stop:880 length:177 start_codon:yes stop_codon:yes gene_type:complete